MTSTFACTDGKLRNPASADKSLIDFRWEIGVAATGRCRVASKEMRSERPLANIPLEVVEPFFEPHFRTDPYPANEK